MTFEHLPSIFDMIPKGSWVLTTFVEPREAKTGQQRHSRPTAVIPRTEVTVEFREEGVSGSAGCNRYGAPVSIDGQEITVEVATVTRAWCDDPAGLMDQERLYLDIMSRATVYRVFGDQLALQTDEGELLLFQAR